METGNRKLGPATCRIRQTVAVPAHMRDKVRELASLEVPASEQRKGLATALVHNVCAEADESGIVLLLWPKPWGESQAMTEQQLVDWYSRTFGFQQIQPEPLLMARQPGSTPRMLELRPTARAAMERV